MVVVAEWITRSTRNRKTVSSNPGTVTRICVVCASLLSCGIRSCTQTTTSPLARSGLKTVSEYSAVVYCTQRWHMTWRSYYIGSQACDKQYCRISLLYSLYTQSVCLPISFLGGGTGIGGRVSAGSLWLFTSAADWRFVAAVNACVPVP